MYDPTTEEQTILLKDKREIFKTHNGFRYWLREENGTIMPINEDYYNTVKKNRVN